MKGRRKVKTTKWHLRALFEAEARAMASKKSANQEQFIKSAHLPGRSAEPTGAMAGIRDA